MPHTLRFSLQNSVYFIMLHFLVPVLFTFYIQVCQNLNVKFGAKSLMRLLLLQSGYHHRTVVLGWLLRNYN
jgi:hypothetical protein